MKGRISYILLIACAFSIIVLIERGLLEQKERLYPPHQNEITKTEEPEQVIGSLMLGGFRIFITDLLWLKMITQEEAGEYHELILTANMITTLEPTYTSVWEYLGYILSNNVSAKEKDPELKLEWVKSALDYLYKGIKRNPDSGLLYVAMGRTINERLGIYKERNLSSYYKSREEGMNPHEQARFYLNEAVKTKNNQVYSERELFIANSYWVRESIFHMRRLLEAKCIVVLALLNNTSDEEAQKLQGIYETYQSKYGKDGNLEEVANRIRVAIDTIRENISIYPGQTDFEPTLETHSKDYEDRYNIAVFLNGRLKDLEAKYTPEFIKNMTNQDINIAKLEIEITLLRIGILGTEYYTDGGQAVMSFLAQIEKKNLEIKEWQKKNEVH